MKQHALTTSLALLSAAFLFGCQERGSTPLGPEGLAIQAAKTKPAKVSVCHIPPGNPGNAHIISVGAPAVPAHLAHGDALEVCLIILLTADLSVVIDKMSYDGSLARNNGLSLQRCRRGSSIEFIEAVPTPGADNACG